MQEINSKLYLHVITQKTGEKVVIPINSVVKLIWEKYDGVLPKAISNTKMNKYIKEVCKLAGINEPITINKTSNKKVLDFIGLKHEFITTHTARRTFCTLAYLNGISSISLMKLSGHKSESSFMRYIKVSQEKNAIFIADNPFFK